MISLPPPDDRRWLLKTVFTQWPRTTPAGILMAVAFVCTGLTPVIIGKAIDQAIDGGDFQRLLWWIGVLAAVFATNAVAAWCARWLVMKASLVSAHNLRMAVTDRIGDPRGMADRKRTAGELLSIASSDTQRVADAVMMTVFPVAEIASVIYVGLMMVSINLWLGVSVLVGGPLVVWIALVAARPLRSTSAKRQRALARAAATATDVVQGLRILKGLGAVDTVRERYRQVSDAAYLKTLGANASQARLDATTDFTGTVYVAGVGMAAGAMALGGTLSVGQLITVVGLTQFIIQPMTMLGKNLASRWASAQASATRIQSVLHSPPEHSHIDQALPATWRELPRGITVVTGPAPQLATFDRGELVDAPHDAELFAGSIGDNVSGNLPVEQAIWVASATDIPGGLEREVGEQGRNLSGGQRQRVALARAIAQDTPLLFLHDPTTAVDSVTEQQIAARVAQQRSEQVTVVFSHAPAWSAVATQVISEFPKKVQA